MTLQEPGDLGYNDFHVSLFYLASIDSNHVQDANVTIALKNLAKKNAVTKEKRLSEFLKMLENSAFDVKDYHILVCWLQLYPRLAIDSQKSVRHLSHQILSTYMDKYGVKEFSKYLKTAMPIWLQGLFDDKSIAKSVKSDLLKCFAGDETKANYKVWVVFHEQIINYCHTVLIHETASSITDERSETSDEVSLKYERAENIAILMLLQTIRLANGQEYFISDSASSQINEILTLNQFWENLGSCSAKENLNAGLFRSFLALITEIFSLTDEGNLKPVTFNLKELKSIFKTTSKKIIKNVKLSPSSDASTVFVYSSVIINLVNALNSLTLFTKQNQIKIKRNFWQYGGLKSYSRLKDLLRIGPCSSDPAYYDALHTFFTALEESFIPPEEDFPFVDFSSIKDAKNIILKILLPHFQNLRGLNAVSFKYRGMQCITHILKLFARHVDNNKALEDIAQVLFITFLDGISVPCFRKDEVRIRECSNSHLAALFVSFLKHKQEDLTQGILARLGQDNPQIPKVTFNGDFVQMCTNFYEILEEVSAERGEQFLQAIIENLEETYDTSSLEQGLNILFNSISRTRQSAIVTNWAVSSIPAFISSELVDCPLNFLKKFLELHINIDYGQMINDFFMKISVECLTCLTSLFGILSGFDESKRVLLSTSTPDAYEYLLYISQNKERLDKENDMVLAFIENADIYANLLGSTEGLARQDTLILRMNSLKCPSTESLIPCALELVHKEHSKKFLEDFAEQGIVKSKIYEKMLTLRPDHDFQALIDLLARKRELIPLEMIENEINQALDTVDIVSLSISNPLLQNINLIKQPASTRLSPFLLTVAAFLKSLSQVVVPDNNIQTLTSICAEYVSDYDFLNPKHEEENIEKSCNAFGYVGVTAIQCDGVSIAQAFNGTSETLIGNLFNKITGKGLFSAKQYYISRVLVRALNPIFESMSLSDFDKIEFSYATLGSNPLKLATLLCSAMKFVGVSSKLDRIRNFVFAEILSVRSTADICEAGLVWISLANTFIDVPARYDILPNHKLGMLVNHLSSWLESDIAFDNLFVIMRALLASFFSLFIPVLGDNVPGKTWEVAIDLCLNNLGMAQSDTDLAALEYSSLKLFLVLSKFIGSNGSEDWEQSRISIEEEILGLTIAKQIGKTEFRPHHQPSILVYDLYERVLLKANISKEILSENVDKLYQMLASSVILGAQKVACSLLQSHIYESQQDVILEVQMRVSNISGESGPIEDLAKFNPILLHAISDQAFNLDDALERRNYHDIFKYLWSWVLVFDHFKESTYSMKAAYINKLRENNSIRLLLNTAFDSLPLSEQAFLNRLVLEPIEKLEKAKPAQSLIQKYDIDQSLGGNEVKEDVYFLLAHLCYQTFQFLGSFALQWFNEIRDVQLKQQVERFSIRFVSPILISEILEDVEKAKDKLTKTDDTLTIKVNKVTNEVKSIYVIDEQTMEMVIRIPERFPLSNVSVEGPTRLGVKENQWKAWLLASQRVITLTNGSIFDCIELFNKNVNLHFSGFEECAICYSILHQDHSLPSKNCPTCLNKFHAACLYKWFKSSGSSTCPLCRSAFNFNTGRS
ncbi:hypothetical protein METBIDRAFT_76595 [Metschnikowia bicuspidata var. bicuspidata NRRL YB-4993]|uniref:E3 ubiquitin-protein ligase listerin n=1 Tax=Metschnikowia bicuspidata var. bicuspidata NRRL YB-4993 TaxID=869754 RepID=A0A1A0HHY2_9ASCO|nr:hypothetical protein METBIDRAFT_76595 [Metschnikowia bicuspidata var. bicuspidata NRRL YB-4993]OBA23611.1 hypothetical protein METBIDRAFT_76595 [Metschnikowia bicuspidata var. bicuspidata NRRL YB-4993]